jgi:hypothetical protein
MKDTKSSHDTSVKMTRSEYIATTVKMACTVSMRYNIDEEFTVTSTMVGLHHTAKTKYGSIVAEISETVTQYGLQKVRSIGPEHTFKRVS